MGRSFFVASSEGICSGLVIIINPPWCSTDIVPDRVHVALSPQPLIELRAVDADAPPDLDRGQLAGGNELLGLGLADAKQLLDVLQAKRLRPSCRVAENISFRIVPSRHQE